MANLTEQEVEELINSSQKKEPATATINNPFIKKIVVIGCGDGGCNIASDIKKAYPETAAIAYNTSRRGWDSLKIDKFLIPDAEDGSGKERDYSKSVFKKGVYRYVLEAVDTLSMNADYVLVISTCDGGTGGGISPMITALLQKNLGIPVIAIGIYPTLSEDAHAQRNLLAWQKEMEDISARYMIFDNESYSGYPKAQIHASVNRDVVEVVGFLLGHDFGKTDIQAIDGRDMEILLNGRPGRIGVYIGHGRPRVGKTLDAFLSQVISENCSQPAPQLPSAYGLFIRADSEYINNVDASIMATRDKYGEGDVFTHLEVSDSPRVALLCSGCTAPEARVNLAAQRYNECMASRKESHEVMGDILAKLSSDEDSYSHGTRRELQDFDLSDLDL